MPTGQKAVYPIPDGKRGTWQMVGSPDVMSELQDLPMYLPRPVMLRHSFEREQNRQKWAFNELMEAGALAAPGKKLHDSWLGG
eukprot:scaffold7491_cov142-Skeletonema_menzelii.AAC.4